MDSWIGNLAFLLLDAIILLFVVVAFLRWRKRRLFERNWFDVEELKRRTDGDEDLLVMDVRTPEDFVGEQGHLDVARNLPIEELHERLGELEGDTKRPIAIVCRTDRRSAKAAAMLAHNGFDDVHVVRGGMTAWLARGWPISRDA